MPIHELNKSRRASITRDSASITYNYLLCIEEEYVDEATDLQVVVDLIYDTFPAVISIEIEGIDVPLVLTSNQPKYLSQYQWEVELIYSLPESESPDTNYLQLNVSTSGGTQKITKSKSVISAVASTALGGGAAPDMKGAIGYTKNGIEGVNKIARGFSFSLTAFLSPEVWNLTYLSVLYSLGTCYNNAPFKGFDTGEVLFVDANASGSLYQIVPVTYNFIAAPNLSGVADAGFANLTALGHDIVDYLYYEEIDSTTEELIMRPSYRYVHRIYDPQDLSILGIGS